MRQHRWKSYTHHTQETRCETTEIENSRRGRIGEVIGGRTAGCEEIGERSENKCEDDKEGQVLVEECAREDYEEESEGEHEGEGNYCF